MSSIVDGFQRGRSAWEIAFGADRNACLKIMSELNRKMKDEVTLNRTDLRNYTKYHCFTLITCTSEKPSFVSECPLTDKQCLHLIKLYNKYMIV